ncbi:uncharacterized protein LOC141899359 isoform X2 [Tubulanus polymorphus]|uniref:uncharacterized protein LOC141899359 isoform X2 n=1 Tax=Tubulanus polymorphus TaxID=672921 RepID=UPI003DA3A381
MKIMKQNVCAVYILMIATLLFSSAYGLNYKNWCGSKNTGLLSKNPQGGCCTCNDPIAKCRQCRPPADGLDEACLQHDRCVQCNNIHAKFHHLCRCERLIYYQAKRANCPNAKCKVYKALLRRIFKVIPCRCDTKICKKYIFWGEKQHCTASRGFKTCPEGDPIPISSASPG